MVCLTDLERLAEVGVLVDVDVTDALGVAQHGDVLTTFLDAAHQLAGPAGDDQVDVALHGQQVADLVPRRHLSHISQPLRRGVSELKSLHAGTDLIK